MNDAHLHLVVNHLPIVFPIVGLIVLLTGVLSKSEPVKRTAYFIFILGAVCSLAAMATGDEAEHFVEKLDGFSDDHIEAHEEAAERFAMVSYAFAAVAAIALWASFKQTKFARILSFIVLAFGFAVLFFAKDAGTSGGEIRHTEIRSDAGLNGVYEREKGDDHD